MKVVIAERNLLPHRQMLSGLLEPTGATQSWHDRFDEDRLVADLADADVYVGGRLTPAMARAGRHLRLVHPVGAGFDKVSCPDLPAQTQVANTFHHENSIAEYVVAAAVTLRRGLLPQDAALRAGRWATPVYRDGLPQPRSLRGAMIGYVGFGHIGRRTADVFAALGARGCAVTGSGRIANPDGLDWYSDPSDLGRLMHDADVVVVSAPLNEHTAGMIGAAELAGLGPGAVLINVGRGPLVVAKDLYEALRDDVIGAAAIDVWYHYPIGDDVASPSELPFAELPNILMTPHISGVTAETFEGRVRDVADNIVRLADGRPIQRVVWPRAECNTPTTVDSK